MKSASLFLALPYEIILQIFESAPDFSVVAALAQTARIFYSIWREHPTAICQAVAFRVFLNLPDAERLLNVQEEAEALSQSQHGCKEKSIIRAKRLLFNARCASAAIENWVDLCQIHKYSHRGEDAHMRPSEITRFDHAFYGVWTIGVMGTTQHLQDQALAFLEECSPRELCMLLELASWARSYNNNDFGSVGLDFYDKVWRAGYDLVIKRWIVFQEGRRHGLPAPDDTPLNFFAFFDHTQRYIDMIEEG